MYLNTLMLQAVVSNAGLQFFINFFLSPPLFQCFLLICRAILPDIKIRVNIARKKVLTKLNLSRSYYHKKFKGKHSTNREHDKKWVKTS